MSSNDQDKKKRPVLVWIISIYFIFSLLFTLLSFIIIFSGIIPLQPAQKAYFENLTIFDHTYTILIMLANLIGAITLFLLRKFAFYFFTFALLLNILSTIYNILSKGWVEAIGGVGLIGSIIGLGIIVAICFYSWLLCRKGILT
jgi:hypothetical protein